MKALVKFAAGEGNIDVLTQIAICGRDIPFPIDQMLYKQLTVRGSITYTARTWQRMMDIYARGTVRLHDLVSAKLPISDWRTAFDLCAVPSSFFLPPFSSGASTR